MLTTTSALEVAINQEFKELIDQLIDALLGDFGVDPKLQTKTVFAELTKSPLLPQSPLHRSGQFVVGLSVELSNRIPIVE